MRPVVALTTLYHVPPYRSFHSSPLHNAQKSVNWSAFVLSSISSDTEPTIVVTFASGKYIFNVGENTNRAFLQSRHNWKKTRGLFLTSVGTQRAIGLPGILMSLADSGISKLDVVGPPGVFHFLAAMRSYTFRDTMPVIPTEATMTPVAYLNQDPQPIFKDENITLYSIPVFPVHDPRPNVRPSTTHWTSSIRDAMKQPGFLPGSLQGELAQEWRKLMVNTTFPGSRPSSDDKENLLSQKRKSFAHPPGFSSQLPKFTTCSSVSPTLAYILIGPRVRGKFDVEKAAALGLPLGRIRSRLTRGEIVSFMLEDGLGQGGMVEKIVRPEDCISESESPGVILILDTPTRAHIASLVSSFHNSFFAKFRSSKERDKKDYAVHAVFHICGDGVLEDERYKKFMLGFKTDVHHLVASREHVADPVTFTSAAFNQLRLNHLDAQLFPLPKFRLNAERDITDVSDLPPNTSPMCSNLLIDIRPPKTPVLDEAIKKYDLFHPALTSTPLSEPTLAQFSVAKNYVQEQTGAKRGMETPGADVSVVPLGTGSALPSKYRNVSATLIQVPGWGNILLDAGEGSWGQLVRQFGRDESSTSNVWKVLRDLKCLFISHIHGDHHIGLAKILSMRRQLDPPPTEPIYLIANHLIHLYIREWSDLEDLGLFNTNGHGVTAVLSEALHWKQAGEYQSRGAWSVGGDVLQLDFKQSQLHAQKMCRVLGLRSFSTVDVNHGVRCYGCVLKHQDGWSIAFSGDTMPTPTLIRAGKNATLLIHEATMADDQADMAARKAHSTFGQAIGVGKSMKAENILLTHFSARYPKLPSGTMALPRTGRQSGHDPIVALAFDHANMRIGDMWKMGYYMPAIEHCFSDTAEDDEPEAVTLDVDYT